MSKIIFNYEHIYNEILIMDDNGFDLSYAKINLGDLYKPTFIKMFHHFYVSVNVFDFKINIYNDHWGPKYITNYNVYDYYTAEKFYNYINCQYFNGNVALYVLNLWKDYEISKFIDGWKKCDYQLEFVKKIEKIYDELIIKSIIE